MKHTRDFSNFINESAKSSKLVPLMVKAIEKVDDSLSYTDFAIAVADIIKEEYGDHNIKPFMTELHKQLGLKESIVNEANTSKIALNIVTALDNKAQLHHGYSMKEALKEIEAALKKHKGLTGKDAEKAAKEIRANLDDIGILANALSPLDVEIIIMDNLHESKDSDTFEGNPGEDKRMVDIRAFRGSVKDLTDFVNDKAKESAAE